MSFLPYRALRTFSDHPSYDIALRGTPQNILDEIMADVARKGGARRAALHTSHKKGHNSMPEKSDLLGDKHRDKESVSLYLCGDKCLEFILSHSHRKRRK